MEKKPDAVFVVKTKVVEGRGALAAGAKVFLNVCKSPSIGLPTNKKMLSDNGEEVEEINMPVSVGERRPYTDRGGGEAAVYDVIFNSKVVSQAIEGKGTLKRDALCNMALTSVAYTYRLQLDMLYKLPKMKIEPDKQTSSNGAPLQFSMEGMLNKEAHAYMTVAIAQEKDLPHASIDMQSRDFAKWGSVDKTLLRVRKSEPVAEVLKAVAHACGVPVARCRLWPCTNRVNKTIRPDRPLVATDMNMEIYEALNAFVGGGTDFGKVYLEVTSEVPGIDYEGLTDDEQLDLITTGKAYPDLLENQWLVFLKFYTGCTHTTCDISSSFECIGTHIVNDKDKASVVESIFKQRLGIEASTPFMLFEQVTLTTVVRMDANRTFEELEIQHGDIIWGQLYAEAAEDTSSDESRESDSDEEEAEKSKIVTFYPKSPEMALHLKKGTMTNTGTLGVTLELALEETLLGVLEILTMHMDLGVESKATPEKPPFVRVRLYPRGKDGALGYWEFDKMTISDMQDISLEELLQDEPGEKPHVVYFDVVDYPADQLDRVKDPKTISIVLSDSELIRAHQHMHEERNISPAHIKALRILREDEARLSSLENSVKDMGSDVTIITDIKTVESMTEVLPSHALDLFRRMSLFVRDGDTAGHVLANFRHQLSAFLPASIDLCLSHEVDKCITPVPDSYLVFNKNDRKGVACFIVRVLTLNVDLPNGRSSLMNAGDLPLVQLLLERGASVEEVDDEGNNILHHAAMHGRSTSVICALYKSGACPTVRNKEGQTAADIARSKDHHDTAVLLDLLAVKYCEREASSRTETECKNPADATGQVTDLSEVRNHVVKGKGRPNRVEKPCIHCQKLTHRRCARCVTVYMCSHECQIATLAHHRPQCMEIYEERKKAKAERRASRASPRGS